MSRFHQREWIKKVDANPPARDMALMIRAVLKVISRDELEAATHIAESAGVSFPRD